MVGAETQMGKFELLQGIFAFSLLIWDRHCGAGCISGCTAVTSTGTAPRTDGMCGAVSTGSLYLGNVI